MNQVQVCCNLFHLIEVRPQWWSSHIDLWLDCADSLNVGKVCWRTFLHVLDFASRSTCKILNIIRTRMLSLLISLERACRRIELRENERVHWREGELLMLYCIIDLNKGWALLMSEGCSRLFQLFHLMSFFSHLLSGLVCFESWRAQLVQCFEDVLGQVHSHNVLRSVRLECRDPLIRCEGRLHYSIVQETEVELLEEMLILKLQLVSSLLQVLVSELSQSDLMVRLNAQSF